MPMGVRSQWQYLTPNPMTSQNNRIQVFKINDNCSYCVMDGACVRDDGPQCTHQWWILLRYDMF